jgi:hypothetical protein
MAFNPPDGNQTIMVDKDSVLQNPQNIFTTSPVICQKGWHYNFIDKSGIGSSSTWASKNSVLVLYLSESFVLESATGGVENPDFVSGFAVGDTVSFVDDNHMVDAFEITAISGNKITIKGGDSSEAYGKINEAANGWVSLKRGQVLNNDYSIYCTAKPTVGNSIMLSGTISNGTNVVLGSEAFVWGRGNAVKSDKSFTAGDGLLNETYNAFIAGRFNAPNPDNDPFIIGMGTSDTDRQNGLAIGGYATAESYLKTTKNNFRFNKPVKIDGTTSSRVVVTDSNNKISSSSVTSTQLGYLSGVTSPIQTQINNLSTSVGNKAEKDASNISAGNITSWKEKLDIDTLETEIDTKATKATTLSGYGITDAYTKTQVDSKVDAKQDKTDNTLTTNDKTIVGAINEVNNSLIENPNELGLTQILKQNGGQLYLNGGYATTNCKPTFGAAQSLMFTYEVSEVEIDSNYWAIIGNCFDQYVGQTGISFAKLSTSARVGFNWGGTGDTRTLKTVQIAQFADGKPHAWALVCGKNETNGFLKLYRDGVLIISETSLALFEDFTPQNGFYFGRAQSTAANVVPAKGRLSRVAFFNFDVSESNADYTLADYQSGKSIPPSLLDATEGNRAVLNLENYTIARNTTTRLVKDLSSGGNDATVTGNIAGDMDRRVEVFVDELKTQIAQSTATA